MRSEALKWAQKRYQLSDKGKIVNRRARMKCYYKNKKKMEVLENGNRTKIS